jgi:hypothetical protein
LSRRPAGNEKESQHHCKQRWPKIFSPNPANVHQAILSCRHCWPKHVQFTSLDGMSHGVKICDRR